MHRRVGTTVEQDMIESKVRTDASAVDAVIHDNLQAKNPPDALTRDPDGPELLHSRALICFEAAQFDQAVDLASRAIRKNPKPLFLTTLGAALLKTALKRKWVVQDLDSRALEITGLGRREMLARFGLRV